ncbi:unnamed protein product [Notodromas monacha]|uniref:C2H2-type domain-containing protein n=1 Tax=Notodromas monacha TaxID=399045 RepID=A0A7R9GC17_9CRUS|nr:unnamed protein product [Notodromas monacha]CAG0915623.1 unnamed protein product [Notodromas monacha]
MSQDVSDMDLNVLTSVRSVADGRCVVCGNDVGESGSSKQCCDPMLNLSVGEFLIKCDVMPAGSFLMSSALCASCSYFVVNADRAWAIVSDSVDALRSRRVEDNSTERAGKFPRATKKESSLPQQRFSRSERGSIGSSRLEVVKQTRCSHCNKVFPYGTLEDKSAFEAHKASHETSIGIHFSNGVRDHLYSCEECGKMFSSDVNRRRHTTMMHSEKFKKKKSLYYCRQHPCEESFSSSSLRNIHERSMHGVSVADDMVEHRDSIRVTTSARIPLHRLPNRRFGAKRRRRTANMKATARSFKCDECGLAYFWRNHLIRHKKNAHGFTPLLIPKDEPIDSETAPQSDLNGELEIIRFDEVGHEHEDNEENLDIDLGAFNTEGVEDSAVSNAVESLLASSSNKPNGAATHACVTCGQLFPRKNLRKSHVLQHHPDACVCCGDLHTICKEEEQVEGTCNVCGSVVPHVNGHKVWEHKARNCGNCAAVFASPIALAEHQKLCCFESFLSMEASEVDDTSVNAEGENAQSDVLRPQRQISIIGCESLAEKEPNSPEVTVVDESYGISIIAEAQQSKSVDNSVSLTSTQSFHEEPASTRRCDVCHINLYYTTAADKSYFEEHLRRHGCPVKDVTMTDKKDRIFRCKRCPRTFFTLFALMKHKKKHHQVAPMKVRRAPCKYCGREFRVPLALSTHLRFCKQYKHTEKGLKTVCICGKSFSTELSLELHEAATGCRRALFGGNDVVSASTGFNPTPGSNELLRRSLSDVGCEQNLMSVDAFPTLAGQLMESRVDPLRIHPPSLTCERCLRVFSTAAGFASHRRVCGITACNVQCRYCHRKFRTIQHCRIHMARAHPNEKEMERAQENLESLLMENHDDPLQTGYTFHQYLEQLGSEVEVTKKKKKREIPCKFCHRKFASFQNLEVHIHFAHADRVQKEFNARTNVENQDVELIEIHDNPEEIEYTVQTYIESQVEKLIGINAPGQEGCSALINVERQVEKLTGNQDDPKRRRSDARKRVEIPAEDMVENHDLDPRENSFPEYFVSGVDNLVESHDNPEEMEYPVQDNVESKIEDFMENFPDPLDENTDGDDLQDNYSEQEIDDEITKENYKIGENMKNSGEDGALIKCRRCEATLCGAEFFISHLSSCLSLVKSQLKCRICHMGCISRTRRIVHTQSKQHLSDEPCECCGFASSDLGDGAHQGGWCDKCNKDIPHLEGHLTWLHDSQICPECDKEIPKTPGRMERHALDCFGDKVANLHIMEYSGADRLFSIKITPGLHIPKLYEQVSFLNFSFTSGSPETCVVCGDDTNDFFSTTKVISKGTVRERLLHYAVCDRGTLAGGSTFVCSDCLGILTHCDMSCAVMDGLVEILCARRGKCQLRPFATHPALRQSLGVMEPLLNQSSSQRNYLNQDSRQLARRTRSGIRVTGCRTGDQVGLCNGVVEDSAECSSRRAEDNVKIEVMDDFGDSNHCDEDDECLALDSRPLGRRTSHPVALQEEAVGEMRFIAGGVTETLLKHKKMFLNWCSLCGKNCGSLESLATHCRKEHGLKIDVATSEVVERYVAANGVSEESNAISGKSSKNLSLTEAEDAQNRCICRVCGLRFKSYRGVAVHLRFAHSLSFNDLAMKEESSSLNVQNDTLGRKSLRCPSCQRSFRTMKGLRMHRVHSVNCDSPFNRKQSPAIHCPRCKKNFTSPKLLRIHVKNCDRSRGWLEGKKKTASKCDICGKLLYTDALIKFHRCHHFKTGKLKNNVLKLSIKPLDRCDELAGSLSSMNKPESKSEMLEKGKENTEGYSVSESYLDENQDSETLNAAESCESTSKSVLSGEAEFECHLCNRIVTESTFEDHFLDCCKPADSARFPCRLCQLSFETRELRRSHVEEQCVEEACSCCGHGASKVDRGCDRKCSICDEIVPHLEEHLKWEHSVGVCSECRLEFSTIECGKRHAWSCSGVKKSGDSEELVKLPCSNVIADSSEMEVDTAAITCNVGGDELVDASSQTL